MTTHNDIEAPGRRDNQVGEERAAPRFPDMALARPDLETFAGLLRRRETIHAETLAQAIADDAIEAVREMYEGRPH